MRLLKEGLKDTPPFLTFPFLDHRKISSTNLIERFHREIGRRSRVVGIFPGMDACLRLGSPHT
ncbi:MAG: hypothetical protein GX147_02810 [Deltaproteobacteria bacterium]|nr:hypothetical protein [Deltaproteobacteria bacterium]